MTLLELGTGHVVGGTTAARRALCGRAGAPWCLNKALGGLYHERFELPGQEEAWERACEAQRRAWGGLGEPLQSALQSCLVLQAAERPLAAQLLGLAAFEGERRAEGLLPAVDKLLAGGELAPEELLAVLEAGA